jgi:hypothetical protein
VASDNAALVHAKLVPAAVKDAAPADAKMVPVVVEKPKEMSLLERFNAGVTHSLGKNFSDDLKDWDDFNVYMEEWEERLANLYQGNDLIREKRIMIDGYWEHWRIIEDRRLSTTAINVEPAPPGPSPPGSAPGPSPPGPTPGNPEVSYEDSNAFAELWPEHFSQLCEKANACHSIAMEMERRVSDYSGSDGSDLEEQEADFCEVYDGENPKITGERLSLSGALFRSLLRCLYLLLSLLCQCWTMKLRRRRSWRYFISKSPSLASSSWRRHKPPWRPSYKLSGMTRSGTPCCWLLKLSSMSTFKSR